MHKLLTLDEVVSLLHTSGLTDLTRKWVSDQIDRGKLPCVVVAKRRRVREDKVREMVSKWMKQAA